MERNPIDGCSISDYRKINAAGVEGYHLCTSILQRLLLDSDLAEKFNDNSKRNKLLRSFMFE